MAGKLPLQLDALKYTNALGQSFSVTKFKYYIGHLVLRQSNGKEFRSAEYFLINEEDSASRHLSIPNVPAGDYTSLEFIIGVDSLDNCSGAQSGALDPVNGMFWAWNTGYIFLKLEGISPASKLPGHIFEYHIGGYKQPTNCIRKVILLLPKENKDSPLTTLHLKVDVTELLQGPSSIDFEQLPSVTDFHNAVRMADNYADMFSISHK